MNHPGRTIGVWLGAWTLLFLVGPAAYSQAPDPDTLIFAARNEWESFRIVVQSSSAESGVNLVPGEFFGPGGAVIGPDNVRLYREHNVQIVVPSHSAEPLPEPVSLPDALIPFNHPLTRQPLGPARFQAVPVDLPANETLGFWVDVYVPPDALPGIYRATYQVTSASGVLKIVPVQLTVWNFELPRVATLKTDFGPVAGSIWRNFPRVSGKPAGEVDAAGLYVEVWDLLRRHRINPQVPAALTTPEWVGGTPQFSDQQIAGLQAFIDTFDVSAVRVAGPLPHALADVYQQIPNWQDSLRQVLSAYDDAYARLQRPQVLFYMYLLDEPESEATYQFVRDWGTVIRQANTVVKVLVTEQTAPENAAWGDLYGAVDIWAPAFSQYRPENAVPRQMLGESIWAYTALGSWQIDYPRINFRAPMWTAWLFGIEGLLYWDLARWDDMLDPWTETVSYTSQTGAVFNGEANLLYPADAVGFDGAVPSIRLKAIRDGIEDYEYLAIAQQRGLGGVAREITTAMLGQYDTRYSPLMLFYHSSALHDVARLILGTLIAQQ